MTSSLRKSDSASPNSRTGIVTNGFPSTEPRPHARVFLSCVTSEFGEHRKLLKADLSLPEVVVYEQADFVEGGGTLIEKLDKYIRSCDAVIHLVGKETGSYLKPAEAAWLLSTFPDFLTRFDFLRDDLQAKPPALTYTQAEGWLALYHGRRCHKYRPSELLKNKPSDDDPQQRHWDRMRSLGQDRGTFDEPKNLCRRVLRALHDLWPKQIPDPICRLPYRTLGELFIGRNPAIERLRGEFQLARTAGRWPVQVIHGLGGVGKTRLAVEYAWHYRDHYTAVFLINGDSADSLDREVAALAGVFHPALDPKLPQPEQTAQALAWLAIHPGWLIIVDNVDSEEARDAVAGKLPALASGHVLITGRISSWPPGVGPLPLHVLARDDAARFLLQATENRRLARADDAEQAFLLADDLGGLCLALQQAATYIAERKVPLAEYRQRWAANKSNVRGWAHKVLLQYHPEQETALSVATTWQTTFDQLHPPARAMLEMLSYLAPDPLPRGLLTAEATETELRTLCDDPTAETEEALAELRRYSLLTDSRNAAFESAGEIHRLVQLIVRDRTKAVTTGFAALTAMLAAVDAYTPDGCYDLNTWPVLTPLQPHLSALTDYAGHANIPIPTSRLLGILGGLLSEKAAYAAAEPLMRQALTIDEASFGRHHLKVATRLNNLAGLLTATNHLAEAESMIRRALTIDEAELGPEHPNVATDLNNLVLLLKPTNRLQEAEALARRALAIFETTHGRSHPNVTIALSNLAHLLEATNRLNEAESLMRRAVAVDEVTLDPEHPGAATRLNNLAHLLQNTGRIAEAKQLMRRAVTIFEASLGPRHPNVAVAANNLGRLLQATNRLAEAEPLMRRALAIDEASLGPHHPRVATRLTTLAGLLTATDRLVEAEPLMRRALAIDETALGPDRPEVAADLTNLANLLQASNRLAEAEALMRRVVTMLERAFGAENPNVATALSRLASLLQNTNRLSEAETMMRRAVAIGEANLISEHPEFATWLNNLALLLHETNRPAEASALMRRSVETLQRSKRTTGQQHPRFAPAVANYAAILRSNGLSESDVQAEIARVSDVTPTGGS